MQEAPRRVTQQVLQITFMLNMYHAELARVLHLRCGDIGQLASGQTCLQRDTQAWRQAKKFIRFYHQLDSWKGGDEVAINHWFRKPLKTLGSTPHLLIIDEDRLDDVLNWLTLPESEKSLASNF